jgi:phage baseplate assembly protein W
MKMPTEDARGFSIPFRLTATGGVVAQTDTDEKLKENIIHILLTVVGERVMRRDYGGGVRALLHDPNNEALRAIVQHQIAQSLNKWEPRVMLQSISVRQSNGTLIADLDYVVRRTRQNQQLSVPVNLGST